MINVSQVISGETLRRFWRSIAVFLPGCVVIALVTFVCFRFHTRLAIVSLLYLVAIVLISLQGRFVLALLSSVVALMCLGYFFVPPVFTFALARPMDIAALFTFLTTALVVTTLVSRMRTSQQRWRDVFENNPTMYFIADARGTVTSVNPFGAEQLGYSVNELVGQPVLNVFYEPDRPVVQKTFAECVEQLGKPMSWEFRKVRKDGTVIWVRETAKAVERASGPIVLIACEDITAAKRAEEALRASEERLQDIVDNTTAVIFVKDLELRYLLVNREFERRHRVCRDQIRGKSDFDILSAEVAEAVRANDRRVIEAREPIQFEEVVPSVDGERVCISSKFLLRDRTGNPYAVCGIATDITESRRAEEMQAAMAREREMLMQQRAADLAKANEALLTCLDALASVQELDQFVGQVMAVITGQLGATSCMLGVHDHDQKLMHVELIFQDGRVMSPEDVGYPERLRSSPLDKVLRSGQNEPVSVIHLALPEALRLPDGFREYLSELGVRTLLFVPLMSRGQANGMLSFRFVGERDFEAEELEIVRALATQASLAIHLTQLAKTAERSAVLEERNRLAGEIHDSLAQNFTGITMQLEMSKEVMTERDDGIVSYIERANDLARFGLAEARRSILSLQPMSIKDSSLLESMQILAERSNIPGRLYCAFRSNLNDDESLPVAIRHDLLRIAQEAISNALRHAKSTAINVSLRLDPPNLILKVEDNGCGITTETETREGFGFVNMRARVKKLNGSLEIRSAPGLGTSIVVSVPVSG